MSEPVVRPRRGGKSTVIENLRAEHGEPPTVEFTPTTEYVKDDYQEAARMRLGASYEESGAEFDRWLAAHDAEVRAEQGELSDAQVEAAWAVIGRGWFSRDIVRAALRAAGEVER